jgi:hypothetical protein
VAHFLWYARQLCPHCAERDGNSSLAWLLSGVERETRGKRGGVSARRQSLFNQVSNLQPEIRVAFALHVAGGEDAIPEGILGALDGIFLVIHEEVSQDFSLRRIGRDYVPASVNDPFGLIKVDGLGDVVWDDGIVLP